MKYLIFILISIFLQSCIVIYKDITFIDSEKLTKYKEKNHITPIMKVQEIQFDEYQTISHPTTGEICIYHVGYSGDTLFLYYPQKKLLQYKIR